MATDAFYRLPLAARTERLRALAVTALARWGVSGGAPEIVKCRENAVFRVTAPDGRRAALRIHRHGYHTDEALRSELAWMEALRAAGVAVPAVVPTSSGALFAVVRARGVPEPRQVDMVTWMTGAPLGTIEDGPGPAVADLRETFRGVGRLAARLHDHAQGWSPPAGFVRHAWDGDGLLGPAPLWGRFWLAGGLGAAERRLIERARERARDDLAVYGRPPRRYGLIHADFNLDNMLLDGDRVALLDFDDSGFGWHLFDLATVWTLFLGADCAAPMRAGVIEGYRRERDLPDEEVARLPLFELARAFSYLGWVETRRETATARVLAPRVAALACDLAAAYLRRPVTKTR